MEGIENKSVHADSSSTLGGRLLSALALPRLPRVTLRRVSKGMSSLPAIGLFLFDEHSRLRLSLFGRWFFVVVVVVQEGRDLIACFRCVCFILFYIYVLERTRRRAVLKRGGPSYPTMKLAT